MKKEKIMYLSIIFIGLLLGILSLRFGYLYGSSMDFINQHAPYAEFFRNIFYETGHFLKEFTMTLGAGTNIFSLAYYGLFNPLLLGGYIMPGISMTTYLMLLNILLVPISGILMFIFLKNKTKNINNAFFTSILFLLATPLLFHAHRQIMFVNYMPFIILGLMSIDYFFKTKKRLPLILCTFFLCLTSYYYSIAGICCFLLYAIYLFLKNTSTKKDVFKILSSFLLGGLLASFLLLPTFYATILGRSGNSTFLKGILLLLPQLDFKMLLYDAYGLGLTLFPIIAVLLVFLKTTKKEERFLGCSLIILYLIPLFMYILNGTLYIRSKVLIPFLPLVILFTLIFIDDYLSHFSLKKLLFFTLIISGLSLIYKEYEISYKIIFIIDIILTLGALYLTKKTSNKKFLLPLLIFAFFITVFTSRTDTLVSVSYNKELKEDTFSNILPKDLTYREKSLIKVKDTVNFVYDKNYHTPSIYSSTVNSLYYNFYKNYLGNAISETSNLMLTSSPNLLFDTFMGVKYVLTDKVLQEEELIKKNVVKNNIVFPLIYVTNDTLKEDTFDKLGYPYTSEALLEKVIVKDSNNEKIDLDMKEINPKITLESNPFIDIKKEDETIYLKVLKDTKVKMTFDMNFKNQFLFMDFTITNQTSCQEKDRFIEIGNVKNSLSCDTFIYHNHNERFRYVLSERGNNNSFEVTLGEGIYQIKNINYYTWNTLEYKETLENKQEVYIDKESSDTSILGKVDVINDGYLVTSIPYDKGFKVLIDGVEVQKEIVNKAFLGTKITKGKHEIKITYHAPYFKEGIILSLSSGFLIILTVFIDYRPKKLVKKRIVA